ncbi:tetratricopeptide repeat protein [Nisaea sp.]|uniref:tetratricopeptide repeat protein n=1 Tax=Nisaea sp. TaxID=2024842 RepID=UPI003B52005F
MSENARNVDGIGRYAERLGKRLVESALVGAQKTCVVRRLALIAPEQAGRWAALSDSDWDPDRSFLSRALQIAPGDYRLHVNRANQWLRSGEIERSRLSLKRAALLEPGLGRAYNTLGAVASSRNQTLRQLSKHWVAGGTHEAGMAMAERLKDADRVTEALRLADRVLAQSPLEADAWRLRAILMQMRLEPDESRRCHYRSMICNPSSDSAYIAAASHFLECDALKAAGSLLGFSQLLDPGSLAARVNLGGLHEREGRPELALSIARQVLLFQPHSADRYFSCSTAMYGCGHFAEARVLQERCSLIAPHDKRFRNNMAILALKSGQYQTGLELYEDRFHAPKPMNMWARTLKPPASFDLPLWDPERRGRQRVLLWGEQGLGDEIWGLSYLTALAGRQETFAVECDERLVPIMRQAFPEIGTFPRRREPDFDWSSFDSQMPILSLPLRLGLTRTETPGGWLRIDPGAVSLARRQFAGDPPDKIVGISWKSIKPLRHRSFAIELDRFAGLADIDHLKIVPLQYDMNDREWQTLIDFFGRDRVVRPKFDVRNDLFSLSAAIAGLDCLVTVAAALVPLAGAVGTSSVVLLRNVQQDWRYGYSGSSSPWLPGATFLRPPASESGDDIRNALMDSLF